MRFLFIVLFSIAGFVACVGGGIEVASMAYNLKGFVGKAVYFLGFDKKSLIAGFLGFCLGFLICGAIVSIVSKILDAILTLLIENVTSLTTKALIQIPLAPYNLAKALFISPFRLSVAIFKRERTWVKILHACLLVVILLVIGAMIYYFNLYALCEKYALYYYKEITTMKRLNYDYLFATIGILLFVNFVSYAIIFIFNKLESLVYIQAMRIRDREEEEYMARLREQLDELKKEHERRKKHEDEQKSRINEELQSALELFGLSENELNAEKIKKKHKALALQFHPDKAPASKNEEYTQIMAKINHCRDILMQHLEAQMA